MDTSLTLFSLLGIDSEYRYNLKRSYSRWFGTSKPLALGQVYATPARLVRDSLVAVVDVETGSGSERKRYEIMPEGHDRISQWLTTPDAPVGPLQSSLFAKAIIVLILDDDAERLLDIQRAEHTDRMRKLREIKKEGGLAEILLTDHALFHVEADLRWINLTASRLNKLHENV